MKKIILAILISTTILAAGCSSKQSTTKPTVTNNTTSQSADSGTSQSADNSTEKASDSSSSTSTANVTSSADYSKYSGNWVTENSLKNDYKYGLSATIKVDKAGNLTGTLSDSTENATHISNVDIKGKIENNKFSYNFDEDGWEHSGTIQMNFNDDKMTLTIKYSDKSSKDNLWGIGEGTFTLVNSNKTSSSQTLTSLKDGGLVVIDKQCFSVKLENFGTVKFISGLKRENSTQAAAFYLLDSNSNVIYKFPDFYGNSKGAFKDISAVSFSDVNNDGLKDVIIITDYTINGSTKTISSIYFQHGTSFANNEALDTKLNNSSSNKDINSVIKYAKSNLN
ncbi:hypothetical protein IAI10_02525 [Clostridium sp. 19966]|uniref:hypothetical protein n=1 Tax=Clostridium sp. 19966 TaxID=2768166 RepID=UPI0028DF4305|nr:hypothetical protein [Clostridium sp. 19966]MDT8715534.1 hypothetical protein [Clostridium sp. 19966]